MITGDVIERVKRQFGDESGVQLTDADIIRYINDGQREIVLYNEEILQTSATLDLTEDLDQYPLPTDLLMPRSFKCRYESDRGYYRLDYLSRTEFNEFLDGWDQSTNRGQPLVCTTYADNLFLYPVSDKSQTDGIKVVYSRNPVDVATASDPLDLPLLYHNSLVSYCLTKANEMDEDYTASGNHLAQMQQSVNYLAQRDSRGAREHYPTITVLREDM